jgi:hypothetical protein
LFSNFPLSQFRLSMPRPFAPGFRFSILDGVILAAGMSAVVFAPRDLAIVAAMAVGHFFLFCNVFRMSRPPELIWAATFTALSAVNLCWGVPGWPVLIPAAIVLAAVLIALETKKPRYHGVGWRRLNPGLPEWWARQSSRAEPSTPSAGPTER